MRLLEMDKTELNKVLKGYINNSLVVMRLWC